MVYIIALLVILLYVLNLEKEQVYVPTNFAGNADRLLIGESESMNREECLNNAMECVTKDRQNTYGSPEDNFKRIANLWNAYLDIPNCHQIGADDVAAMLALLKIARIASGNSHSDNWVDLAGYAACGCELQTGGE